MEYQNQMPHDDYDHFEDIVMWRFDFTYTNPDGLVIAVKYNEQDGDTLTIPGGRVIDDPDDVDEYLGDGFDHYWEACQNEQNRLFALRDEMEAQSAKEGLEEIVEREREYRRVVCG